MAGTATKTNPKLWDKIKKKVEAGDKGGEPGQWSARKAQLAVQEYKKQGGGYAGGKAGQAKTHLHEWTAEDWGTKSGMRSKDTGERYLPRKARGALSSEAYDRTTAKKRKDTAKGKQFSAQPKDVAAKTAATRSPVTKAALLKDAARLGIKGRTRMTKEALQQAVRRAERKTA